MKPETLLLLSMVIILMPLLSFTVIIFNQKRLQKAGGVVGSIFQGLTLLLTLVVAFTKLTTYADAGMIQEVIEWFSIGNKTIKLGLGLDNLAAIMLVVVNLISFLVHVFSTVYMHGDKRFPRFFAYLGLFTFSMLGIVLANNFLNMYIFWELVGVSSYLLIGFWYEKDSAANANKKAFITNRIGDFGFLIGILILFANYGTLIFDEVYAQIAAGNIPYDSGAWLTAAGILIFAGAIGKSAQFPLHVWLPDAMEGPTPVSALIHAATMVAAGVYLTARIFPMLTADAMLFVAYVGGITAFLAATIAITQNDFKKVLAYSTVSQLGYMVLAIGVGAFTTGFMHLVTHAWFKACLFLASGSVIHAMHESMHHAHNHDMDPQDIRNMGGLRKTMPITYATFLFATLAISGVPFTSGFLSKDGILAGTLAFAELSGHWLLPLSGFGAAAMTAFYMFRLTISAFHGNAKTDISAHTKENSWQIVGPLVLLAVLSISFFYSWNPFNAGSGWFHDRVKTPMTVVPAEYQFDFMMPLDAHHGEVQMAEAHGEKAHSHSNAEEAHSHSHGEEAHVAHAEAAHGGHQAATKFEEQMHHAHIPAMIASLLIAGGGILFGFAFYQFKVFNADNLANLIKPAYNLSFNKWFIDEIYQASFINGTINLGRVISWFDLKVVDGAVNAMGWISKKAALAIGVFDKYVVDGIVNFTADATGFFGALLRKVQTGKVQAYLALTIIIFMIILFMAF
jgi:NADH-quinone oxidoreductase subunit L